MRIECGCFYCGSVMVSWLTIAEVKIRKSCVAHFPAALVQDFDLFSCRFPCSISAGMQILCSTSKTKHTHPVAMHVQSHPDPAYNYGSPPRSSL